MSDIEGLYVYRMRNSLSWVKGYRIVVAASMEFWPAGPARALEGVLRVD